MQRHVARQDKLKYQWKFVMYLGITIFMSQKRCSSPDSNQLDERNEPSYLQKYEHLFVTIIFLNFDYLLCISMC